MKPSLEFLNGHSVKLQSLFRKTVGIKSCYYTKLTNFRFLTDFFFYKKGCASLELLYWLQEDVLKY